MILAGEAVGTETNLALWRYRGEGDIILRLIF